MRALKVFFHRLSGLFRRQRWEDQMNEEIRAHLEGLVERNLDAGMTPLEARYAALRTFGGMAQVKERARDERQWRWMVDWLGDVRFAARMLRKHPGFTFSVVLTLALGLGVNTALFTLFDVFVLRPLPLHEAERLVNVAASHPRNGRGQSSFSYPDYLAYRGHSRTISDLIATRYESQITVGLSQPGIPRVEMVSSVNSVPVWYVSDNYFSALRPTMALGQAFLPAAGGGSGASSVMVLSHRFWLRDFNADPDVVGKTLRLDGQVLTIIGVAAPDFTGLGLPPRPTVGWVPLPMHREFAGWQENRKANVLTLAGRLAPGVTVEQAAVELQGLRGQIAPESAQNKPDDRIVVWHGGTLLPKPPGAQWPALVVLLLIGFTMVMALACANVMNLLLARAATRQQEIAMRLAAGATRWRLVRQLLTESLMLSVLGGIAGLILGAWALQGVYSLVMSSVAIDSAVREWLTFNLSPDLRVFGFGLGLVVIAGLVTGLTPALAASRADVNILLQGGGSLFSGRIGQSRLRDALVVLQVALSLGLLIGAGLLARNVGRQTADVGFETERLLALLPVPSTAQAATADEWRRFAAEVETKLAGVPGVSGVGRANFEVLRTYAGTTPVVADTAGGGMAGPVEVPFGVTSPRFLNTVGVPLLRGRMFTDEDAPGASPVVIVSDSLARKLWPGLDPVGRQLQIAADAFTGRVARGNAPPILRTCEVVGVVKDAIYGQIMEPNPAGLFLPWSPSVPVRASGAGFLVRTEGDSRAVMGRLRTAVEDAGGLLLQQNRVSDTLAAQRAPAVAAALLAGAVGGLGLAVAAVGLGGVIAFNVNRRTREIGIRVALGAAPRVIVQTFIRKGMYLVAVGVGFGVLGGAVMAILVARALPGVRPFDPMAFGGVTVILVGVAFFACWLPARRAARVAPMVALRAE